MSNETFIHEFSLLTNSFQERKLNIKFQCLRELYNNVLSECFYRLKQIKNDPLYAIAIDLYNSKNNKNIIESKVIFKELDEKYQFKKIIFKLFLLK